MSIIIFNWFAIRASALSVSRHLIPMFAVVCIPRYSVRCLASAYNADHTSSKYFMHPRSRQVTACSERNLILSG